MLDDECVDDFGHQTDATTEVVLAFDGELDLDREIEIESEMMRALDGAPHTVVVDLARVTFIDSSGLRAFLLCQQAANAAGITFRLRDVPAPVAKLLKVAGLRGIFTIEP